MLSDWMFFPVAATTSDANNEENIFPTMLTALRFEPVSLKMMGILPMIPSGEEGHLPLKSA